MELSGSIVALVTPMSHGKVDRQAIQALAQWHFEQGTDALVIVGSTGEGGMLTEDERREALCAVVEKNASLPRKLPIIAGCGTLSTSATVNMVQAAESYGVDAVMVVSPCYVKPTQEGLFRHFRTVAESTKLPMVIYNHPGRTGVNLQNDTLLRLCEACENIVAIKDSNPDLSRIADLRMKLPRRVSLLSGDDATNIGFLAQGGNGIVSVTANVLPDLCKAFTGAWTRGDVKTASELHERLMPVHRAMFCEPNPCPAVFAVSKLRGICNEVRPPLLAVEENSASAQRIMEAIQNAQGVCGCSCAA